MMAEGFRLSNVVSFSDYSNTYKERSGPTTNHNFIGYFTCKSNLYFLYVPMIVEAWATPTIHTPLFASAAISPVTSVPWLFANDIEN